MPWRRRHAVQIAAQLPDNPDDALLVLELAEKLVKEFLMEPESQRPLLGTVTLFAPSPSRTAKS